MTSPLYSLINLGGVQVGISGPTDVLPALPTPDHLDKVWPTSKIAMYSRVMMTNGKRWQVMTAPRRTGDGDVIVTLSSPPPQRVQISVSVPRYALDESIWWVGELPPPSEPEVVPGTGERSDESPSLDLPEPR